jgi:CBS-domain-containing membrane protein
MRRRLYHLPGKLRAPLVPVAAGAGVLLAVAVVANNVVHHRQYPRHWW